VRGALGESASPLAECPGNRGAPWVVSPGAGAVVPPPRAARGDDEARDDDDVDVGAPDPEPDNEEANDDDDDDDGCAEEPLDAGGPSRCL
jgi:hypothetical protein